jgi:hypothetical protein
MNIISILPGISVGLIIALIFHYFQIKEKFLKEISNYVIPIYKPYNDISKQIILPDYNTYEFINNLLKIIFTKINIPVSILCEKQDIRYLETIFNINENFKYMMYFEQTLNHYFHINFIKKHIFKKYFKPIK